MNKILARFLFCLALIGAPLAAASAADLPVLTVYTYNSFVSDWGPGPQVKKAFEAECACRIDFVGVEDGVVLLSRLRLEGASSKADVVLGLDTNLTAEAAATGLFAPHGLDLSALKLPIEWKDQDFVPYDFGYFAFVWDTTRLKNPPKSLADLVGGGGTEKILIEDPRSSTPGLGLLLWIKQVYGDRAARGLAPAPPAHPHGVQELGRGLWPLPQGRGAHGAELHDLARLSHHRGEEDPIRRGQFPRGPLSPDRGGGGDGPCAASRAGPQVPAVHAQRPNSRM